MYEQTWLSETRNESSTWSFVTNGTSKVLESPSSDVIACPNESKFWISWNNSYVNFKVISTNYIKRNICLTFKLYNNY